MSSDVYKIYEMVDNFCKSNDSNILPSSVVRYIKSCDLSVSIVYNNFPWPDLSDSNKLKLTESANNILKARNCYPNKSLHDLYCVDKLDDNIAAAHRDNDELVMDMYGLKPNMGNEEILDDLIKLTTK